MSVYGHDDCGGRARGAARNCVRDGGGGGALTKRQWRKSAVLAARASSAVARDGGTQRTTRFAPGILLNKYSVRAGCFSSVPIIMYASRLMANSM